MKKIFFLLFTVLVSLTASAGGEGITFTEGKWADIVAKASASNKYIFVDCYTTWCGPCKWLAKNIFPNKEVAEFYNSNFINVSIDMEKGEGIELAKAWGIRAYPTLMFFNSKGEMVHRTCGVDYRDDYYKDFIKLGKTAMDPNEQFIAYKKKVDAGNADAKTKAKYISLLAGAYLDYQEELNKYFGTLKDEELLLRHNWNLIYGLNSNFDSREVQYLLNNRVKFEKLYTMDSVATKLGYVYGGALMNAWKDTARFEKLKREITASGLTESDKIIWKAEMYRYKSTKDWTNYAKVAVAYTDKYSMTSANELNSMAWTFYEKVDDKNLLANAERWAMTAVKLDPNYANTDTYASVLFKLGKFEEAKKQAQAAIDLAKKENTDYKETQVLLDKMNGIK
jgi:thioredoxin-related protein